MATELLVKIKQWKIQWDRRHLEIENRTGTRPKKCKKDYYVISVVMWKLKLFSQIPLLQIKLQI